MRGGATTIARSTVIAAEVVFSVNPAPPCISYYKQNKLYRLVYDDSRQLECLVVQNNAYSKHHKREKKKEKSQSTQTVPTLQKEQYKYLKLF